MKFFLYFYFNHPDMKVFGSEKKKYVQRIYG